LSGFESYARGREPGEAIRELESLRFGPVITACRALLWRVALVTDLKLSAAIRWNPASDRLGNKKEMPPRSARPEGHALLMALGLPPINNDNFAYYAETWGVVKRILEGV
jgi:hypothetical protein